MVVDYGFGVQPQCADEAACVGRIMAEQADEGYTVWVYSYSWSGDRAFPPINCEDIGESPLKRIADRGAAPDNQIGGSLRLRARKSFHQYACRKCFVNRS